MAPAQRAPRPAPAQAHEKWEILNALTEKKELADGS